MYMYIYVYIHIYVYTVKSVYNGSVYNGYSLITDEKIGTFDFPYISI